MFKCDALKFLLLLSFIDIRYIHCRNHDIKIKNDKRQSILLSHFGYFSNGYLFLNLTKLNVNPVEQSIFGFSLDISSTSSISSYVESSTGKCMLDKKELKSLSAIVIKFNQTAKIMTINNVGPRLAGVLIYDNESIGNESNYTISPNKFNFTMDPETKDKFSANLIKLFSTFIGKRNASEIVEKFVEQHGNSIMINAVEFNAIRHLIRQNQFTNIDSNVNIQSDLKVILMIMRKQFGRHFTGSMKHLFNRLHNAVAIHYSGLPMKLTIIFPTIDEEGDIDLYFHHCASDPHKVHPAINLSLELIEKNWNSFLSAGDQPLPLLFFIMCSLYLILAMTWAITLRTSKHLVYKIHYLMLVLLIMKALTLFFHAINYYEIGRYGVQEQGWAIMYYITHLLKGALLFTTIILIGAGWAFIKHMLSGKEKKIFIIIIPLQILANIATIIIDESEESTARYLTWRNIFLLVDLICCGAILFPVIWSIKHLKEAANIDGKQEQNLVKLRLFRHFYILIICYIYFTRIIVYLLIITVSFKLTWTVDLFRELSTVVFMVITGYKFRPISNNPYLIVPNDDEEFTEQEQLEHAWSQSGITAGVIKLNHSEDVGSGSDEENVCYENSNKLKQSMNDMDNRNRPIGSGVTQSNGVGVAPTTKL